MTPRFTFCVVSNTNFRGAKACHNSLHKTTLPFRLHLTANGNPCVADYFREFAAEFTSRSDGFFDVLVVENEKNEGFQKPNTEMLNRCETPFAVFLNDDAIPPPEWLQKLVEPFDADVDMVSVGQQNACCSLRENFFGYKGDRYEYVEFSAAMIRTSVAKEHGLFSDYIEFAGCDDSDFSLRMRELGYHIAKADFAIRHEVGATRRNVPGLAEIFQRNLAACQHRWADYLKSKDRKFPCER
jgi:GT2 family glycosyltransferase